MDIDRPAPARSLARSRPGDRTSAGVHHTLGRPWPYVLVAIDGAWRHGVVGGWSQERPGGPVIVYVEWSDGRSGRADHLIHDPDLMIPGERD
ncbi:hypothetical protein, partial [Embleya sp. NPDC005971]|uniref:hypothetical protein n=1 Tax=Embleya sp. NPDC005971 TaxID=3156724 RepID=UPI0033FE04A9